MYTVLVEQDGPWFVAQCPEVPGANGQARTHDECVENLHEAIALIEDHRKSLKPRAADTPTTA